MNYVLIPVGADHYLVRFNDDKLLACVLGKRIVSPVNPAPNETCEVKWHYKNVYGATVLFIGKLDN